jgi:tellurium resistance protein TerD
MVDDIFDTRFENKDIELDGHIITVGDDINVTAKDPTMRHITVGMGWDLNAFDADALDLDMSAFMLNRNNGTRDDGDFVFYNNLKAYNGGVAHNGDSRTGAGDGDDESITISLETVPFDILKIVFVLSVYKGYEKEQTVGMVRNAYIRLMNTETRHEILRFQLNEILKDRKETGLVVASLNREGPKWHFTPVCEFIPGGLAEIATRYGMVIGQE